MRRRLYVVYIVLIAVSIISHIAFFREGMTYRPPTLNIRAPDMTAMRKAGFDENKIYEFDDFLTGEQCDELIRFTASRVSPSHVVCSNGMNCMNPSRTSKHTFVKDSESPTAEHITRAIEGILKINRRHFEELQVVHYERGKEYKEHWDACVSNEIKNCDQKVVPCGQRYATFLIYLNDNFQDGETCFPRRNNRPDGKCEDTDAFKMRAKKGKAILFFNLDPDGIRAKDEAIHAGLPPSSGEKWICNKWIRTGNLY